MGLDARFLRNLRGTAEDIRQSGFYVKNKSFKRAVMRYLASLCTSEAAAI